jgi:signal transduction histidine kinase
MTSGRLSRSFLIMLMAAAPPVAGAILATRMVPTGDSAANTAILLGGIFLLSLAWIAFVATWHSRFIRAELSVMLRLAEHGSRAGGGNGAGTDAVTHRLASTLEERNRQVAELAAQVSEAPIGDEPRNVVSHVVMAAQRVTRDPTWELAVLGSALPDRLAAGVYDGSEDEAAPIDELHRWASVAASEGLPARAKTAEGPWGKFTVISLAATDQLRAVLFAPWEGRLEPSDADLALLSLVGEHATTAIEHAILYTRVRMQADAIDKMASVQRDFLRSVTHDLQSPLTSIRAAAGEVRAQPGLDEQAGRDLDLIEHQADRLRRMVAQLLIVSRLEAGVVEPQPEILNPRPIVERTWAALRATDRRLEIEAQGPPLIVVADPDRLEQVLWAVLDNAVKYSTGQGCVRVRIGANGDRARISISDEGMGMDAGTAERVFEQFFRAPGARRVAPDGSGIGLYAAKGLVEAMGGTIAISSRLGQGTTVEIELPAEAAEEDVDPARATAR